MTTNLSFLHLSPFSLNPIRNDYKSHPLGVTNSSGNSIRIVRILTTKVAFFDYRTSLARNRKVKKIIITGHFATFTFKRLCELADNVSSQIFGWSCIGALFAAKYAGIVLDFSIATHP